MSQSKSPQSEAQSGAPATAPAAKPTANPTANKSYARSEMKTDEVYEFFVVCAPGLEEIAGRELLNWFPDLPFEQVPGGLVVRAPLAQGFALNTVLKSATRVLIRLAEFGCRDFPKLYRKMQNFALENWIGAREVSFNASTTRSRLKIKKRIEETCADAWRDRLKKLVVKSEPAATEVYVRFSDDVGTISLDTSGELLHKRAQRLLSSEAPLRETLAAGVLLTMARVSPPTKPVEIFDPMTGGGTFLLEAAQLFQPVESRDFAFAEFATSIKVPVPKAQKQIVWSQLTGFERDPKTAASAQANLRKVFPGVNLEVQGQDFFEVAKIELNSANARWVVVNPPYGRRLAVDDTDGSGKKGVPKLAAYYEKLWQEIEDRLTPDLIGMLMPRTVDPTRLKRPAGWKFVETKSLLNGGLPIYLTVLRVHRDGR